ncbi:MAG: protein kinase, partial [Planctomycetes bacterium]|nr:protein kinase [Planctomycetota bacterium]
MQTPATGVSGRELTLETPATGLSGRELTMQTPAAGISGRELTMQTPATGLSGRELTMQTPATGLSGRELTLETPATGISGREMTLETPATGISGREMTLETPATGISGRELTMQPGQATPTPATVGARPRTDHSLAGFKPRTGVGTSIAFDDAWHLQGRKGPHTGQTWGDFDLGGVLGEGGMGAVYRAKQKSLRRRVAIKVLPPNLAQDVRLLQRFQLEASTTSKLQTPHVVQVYAIGEHEGNHFYAMEYVEGKDLYDIIKERREASKPLTADEAVGFILQAAKGLAEAGRHGIVHRDIKPPNMMVTKDGLLKIADFGIVKVLGEHQLTMTGQAVGTPAYVSPEQGRGDKEVDCRSDLYSLGVVFYELACDKKPFDGSTPNALIYQHCYEEPKLPKELNAAISDEVQAVIMRCLQKKPENRYQSADELVRDLEAIKTGSMLKSAIANYKLGTGADEAKREQMTWLQRNMLPVAAASLLVIGGAVGGLFYWKDIEAKKEAAAAELRGKGEKAILEKKGAIAKSLDAVEAIPGDIGDRIAEVVGLVKEGEQDPDVVRWRRKIADVEALAAKLVPIESGTPTPAARAAARKDLDAYRAKVGDDVRAVRWAGRLQSLDTEEARLRGECARLETQELRLGLRQRFDDQLKLLSALVPADDPQLVKWNGRLQRFDTELTPLLARIAPLEDDQQVTVAERQRYLPVLSDLRVYLDADDPRLERWKGKLDSAGKNIDSRRVEIETVVKGRDRIGAADRDLISDKLADYAALVGEADPQLKDWRNAIAAGERAAAGARDRLKRAADDSGDGLLPEPVHDAFERDLAQLAAYGPHGDAELLAWQAQLRSSRATLDGLRKDCAALAATSTAEVTLAAQRDLKPKVERLANKGAIEPERADVYRARLATEAARVAAIRQRLKPFDEAESVTTAMRTDLERLAIDAGAEDPDVQRWTAKRDRVDALVTKLSALDNRQGVPDDVGALFAELGRLVGEKDAKLVGWQGKVQRIEAARRDLAVLDRRQTFAAAAIAEQLKALADLVGEADRRLVAWRAKADEVAALKAELARLPAALVQDPAANTRAHAAIRRLAADLVGTDDPEVQAAARRQQELDGPGRPAWATGYGR